jgi:hypothetical protein
MQIDPLPKMGRCDIVQELSDTGAGQRFRLQQFHELPAGQQFVRVKTNEACGSGLKQAGWDFNLSAWLTILNRRGTRGDFPAACSRCGRRMSSSTESAMI